MVPLETAVLKHGPLSPLIVKLGLYGQLSDHDVDTIGDLRYTAIEYRRNQRITTLSVIPPCVYVMVSGLACLSVLASDGRRQITRFLLPGDFCNVFDAEPIGSIEGLDILAPTRMAAIPAGVFHQLGASPSIYSNSSQDRHCNRWIHSRGYVSELTRFEHTKGRA